MHYEKFVTLEVMVSIKAHEPINNLDQQVIASLVKSSLQGQCTQWGPRSELRGLTYEFGVKPKQKAKQATLGDKVDRLIEMLDKVFKLD